MNKLMFIPLTAALALATAFTLSCSGDNDDGGNPSPGGGGSSSSVVNGGGGDPSSSSNPGGGGSSSSVVNGGGGDPSSSSNPGDGINTYIGYDGDGSRYKLVVTKKVVLAKNSGMVAFTPQSGDTYTLTVEGLGWGTSTGTVTSFNNDSYTLSNNGTALNLTTSDEAISSIPTAIVYNTGEHSQMSDGTKTPNGSVVTKSIYFDTWVVDDKTLTMTTTGWTFSSPGGGMQQGFNYSGTYAIVETTTGTAYELYTGSTSYRIVIIDYFDHDKIYVFPKETGITEFELTRQ